MHGETEHFTIVPFFEDLEAMEIAEMLEISKPVNVKAGDVIIEEGMPGDGLYIISQGKFAIVKGSGENETILARLSQLSFFGEMSLISAAACAATVRCEENGRLTKFPAAEFNERLEQNHLVAFKVVRSIARTLADRLTRAGARIAVGGE
jgi:CRP-like cAMP-binding protein